MKMFNFAIENKETNNEKNNFYFRAGCCRIGGNGTGEGGVGKAIDRIWNKLW